MLVAAVRGAVGFLTRLPVAQREGDWSAFAETPLAFPLAGYLVGGLVAIPMLGLFLNVPALTVAPAYVVAVYLLTGVNHVDGLADVGDAAAVHGTPSERRSVLTDTDAGVGAVVAVAVVVTGLALGAYAVSILSAVHAIGLVVASEVGAKLGMATVACLGEANHAGMGREFTRNADPALLLGPAVVAVPAALLPLAVTGAVPALASGLSALVAGPFVAVLLVRWAHLSLDGVSGDVFGAANELGRLAALHAGVVAWVLI